ncbi:MAG: hypothetical protein K1060chlam1_00609 [Candidatus Anoxychlamydiales bacterium]|nr:hypothetical protein [Candidatus Anoxychlamydiales bacterium]
MKKLFLVLTIFSTVVFSKAKADEPVFDRFYMQHYVSFGNTFVVMLDDNSMWELFCFKPRSQTWSEWWNSVKINVDENFLWKEGDWMIEDQIIIGENNLNRALMGKLKDDDQTRLRSFHYVIENLNAEKVAFARPISFAEFTNLFIEYSNYQYDQGYSVGSSSGYLNGYNVGYSDGKKNGYDKGYKDGVLD